MAKTTVVQISDDLDGSPNAKTCTFALQGVEYEIDLSSKNLKGLEKALKPYLDVATKVSKRSAARRGSATKRDLSAVRVWAHENGHEVSERGRVPKTVLEAYDSAH